MNKGDVLNISSRDKTNAAHITCVEIDIFLKKKKKQTYQRKYKPQQIHICARAQGISKLGNRPVGLW